MKFFNLYLVFNHSLAPFLDLLTVECTRDTKVDHLSTMTSLAENV